MKVEIIPPIIIGLTLLYFIVKEIIFYIKINTIKHHKILHDLCSCGFTMHKKTTIFGCETYTPIALLLIIITKDAFNNHRYRFEKQYITPDIKKIYNFYHEYPKWRKVINKLIVVSLWDVYKLTKNKMLLADSLNDSQDMFNQICHELILTLIDQVNLYKDNDIIRETLISETLNALKNSRNSNLLIQ